jgi:glycyl-tRNA synthetase beta chain
MLAKADLVTGMVFEFTELQGVMGRRYAQIGGEPQEVAEAIYEHYLPRFNGDEVADTPVGIAVSLADKLDTIVAVFSQKNAKLPSGSKDPLGLRRMASGIIQTVLENRLSVDLPALMQSSYRLLVESVPAPEPAQNAGDKNGKNKGPQFQDEQTTLDLVCAFILQRLRGLLLEQGNRYDIVDAALESGRDPLSDIQDVLARIEHLKKLTLNADALKKVYEPANRIFKILGEQYNQAARAADVQPALLKDPAEQVLFEQVKALEAKNPGRDYEALITALSGLNEAIERFFEKVMVNDPDQAVRKNRYNLLSVLNRFYLELACFTKLVV